MGSRPGDRSGRIGPQKAVACVLARVLGCAPERPGKAGDVAEEVTEMVAGSAVATVRR